MLFKISIKQLKPILSRAIWLFRTPVQIIKLLYHFERLYFWPMRKVAKGEGCLIDVQTWLVNGKNIVLGDHVKVSAFSTIMAGTVAKVSIGDYTIIGPMVMIIAINHRVDLEDVPIRYQGFIDTVKNSVTIGKDVWIGGGVTILPGVTIGDGAVIGAGAVVLNDIPPHTIYINKINIDNFERFQSKDI